MRSYIRHPVDIPLDVQIADQEKNARHLHLNNVSHGGLAFNTADPVECGTMVKLSIDLIEPPFEVTGMVTHCHANNDGYVVGVEFINRDDMFVARMVEQICHIEHYRKEVQRSEGRKLSGQEAAMEWVERFAGKFPKWTA